MPIPWGVPQVPQPQFADEKYANRLYAKTMNSWDDGIRRPFSYDMLKGKGIYVYSYQNGRQYALSKVKPMPSYMWRRLEYLPERIKLFEIVKGTNKREYVIVVAH